MTEQFINDVQLTLGAPCAPGDMSLTLAGVGISSLPTVGTYRFLIESEIIVIASRSGVTATVATRGAEGTTAAAHASTTLVAVILTAGAIAQLKSDLAIPSTSQVLQYGGTVAYNVLGSDAIVIFDTSGWTNQAAQEATLGTPSRIGERHVFFWDKFVNGSPPPLVSGGANPIVPYSQNVQVSGARAPGNVTAIIDNGGVFPVQWTGSYWGPG
jgi:hypothetical protein